MGINGHHLSAAAAIMILTLSAAADPSDETCLTHFWQSLDDPLKNLQNWTKSTFANPCDGSTSFLQGATCNGGRIYKLSLSNLFLRGSISPFLSNCTNLQSLDLSSNQLTGPIPPELQRLANLAVLALSENELSGPIPAQLALCAYLNVIDLRGNQLSGPVPPQLGLLGRLSDFDVSNNKLSGEIPASLARFNGSSYGGNKGLYGYPLTTATGSRGLNVKKVVVIGLGSGLISLVLSFTVVCVWLRCTDNKYEEDDDDDQGKPDHLAEY